MSCFKIRSISGQLTGEGFERIATITSWEWRKPSFHEGNLVSRILSVRSAEKGGDYAHTKVSL